MAKIFWSDFKEWLAQSFAQHPAFTIVFGALCFFVGAFFL